MIAAPSYDHIDRILNEEELTSGRRFSLGIPKETGTVGFILFDQNFSRYPITDLVANLDMLHIYSGTDIHFFLCGVSQFGPSESGARELGELNGVTLYHNAEAAYSFVKAFEREIPGWNYDLGFELVLVDVVENNHIRTLDFNSSVFFKVEELIKVGIIERPSELFNKLVKFARDGNLSNAAAFRDELERVFGINWLKGLILAMFPKSVGRLARTKAVLGGSASLPE
ncbi:hypothetical protein [Candidatus Phaeomarinobacter ectocarpi]|uniref:hypothetical protein n=1 Tax=Candidatus Phaeomarinibacter ectocarpi TaxID=1458461 RepID=UPI0005C5C046|nr:hypothetical protein [Candidatus Phaeomarinobacter ectocarpi]